MPLDPNGFTDHQILVKIWDKLDDHIVHDDARMAAFDKAIGERPSRREVIAIFAILVTLALGLVAALN